MARKLLGGVGGTLRSMSIPEIMPIDAELQKQTEAILRDLKKRTNPSLQANLKATLRHHRYMNEWLSRVD